MTRERDELRAEVERLRAQLRDTQDDFDHSLSAGVRGEQESERLRAEHERQMRRANREIERQFDQVERLRAALARLVELGDDDGSASDDAWKSAFEQARALCQK